MLVLFDFDGTIADTIGLQIKIASDILTHEFGYKFSQKQVKKFRNILNEKGLFPALNFARIPIYKYPQLFKKVKERQVGKMVTLKISPDIKQCIKDINKLAKVGILSSGYSNYIDPFIESNNITQLFDYVYTDDKKIGKGQLFDNFLSDTKIAPEEIIYVGDETNDIKITHKLKIKTIAVTWGVNSKKAFFKLKPELVADTPSQILNYVKSNIKN